MTYSETLDLTILFGGVGGGMRDDTWVYDGSEWRQLTLSDAPSERGSPAMAHAGPRQATILFGGHYTFHRYNDTWELVLAP